MTTKTTNQQAERMATYKEQFDEAATLLKVLVHHVENLGHENLNAINWGDIGDAASIVQWLRLPVAMMLNLDDTDPVFPNAIAAYIAEHGLAQKKVRCS